MIANCAPSELERRPINGEHVSDVGSKSHLGTVIHFCLSPDGGVWTHIRLLAAQQRPQWRTMVVAVARGEVRDEVVREAQECADRSLILSRPPVTAIHYLAPVRVRRILRELGVDPSGENVVFHFHTGPSTPWFFKMPSSIRGQKLATYHGSLGNFRDTGLKGFPRRLVGIAGAWKMRWAGYRFVAVSRRSVQDCAAMYLVPESAFRVAYSGVVGGEHRRPRTVDDKAPFHIGFLGTVQPGKGWDRVIAAAKLVRERGKNIICTIAGDGGQGAELRKLAAENSDWLRAPGRLQNPSKTFLPGLDVVVLPSDFEGLPLVLPEAMSCGVPCICTDVGGCAEAVRDGQEGFVLRQNAADEIADDIVRLIDDRELWLKFSQNSRQRYEDVFTPERMMLPLEDLYLGTSVS